MRKTSFLVAVCSLTLLAQTGTPPSLADFTRVIRANDLHTLKSLAATPAAVNVSDGLHNTPLHYAAIYGSPQSIQILLNAGASPNATDSTGATPLIYAAWNFEETRLFVEHGAAVNAAQHDGVTPLFVASSTFGNAATVRYLIEKGADARALDNFQDSPLLRAVSMSDCETVKLLLAHGADARLANRAGFNSLHGAIEVADIERIRLLLSGGADPNSLNRFSGTVKHGPIALIHLSPLMFAADTGQPAVVNALLESGARINESDSRKMNSLMFAIATDLANPVVVKQLIAAGADVNAQDQYGESVLTWARKYRNPDIMAALENAGAHGAALPPAPQPPPASPAASTSAAAARSLSLLAASSPQFFRESGCSGCHHQSVHVRAYAAATQAGLHPDIALRDNFTAAMVAVRPRVMPGLPVLQGPPGDYDTLLSYVSALADLAAPPTPFTDLIVHYVAERQDSSGGWVSLGVSRPPLEESSFTRTAQAVRALKVYGWPARRDEFAHRIQRARLFLERAQPVTTYEWADKISGLYDAGVPAAALTTASAALLRLQHPDGGWAQTRYLDSDAYATGLVLSSLYRAGLLSPHDSCYQKGVAFLLRTQFPDGSWYVRSRAPKFQPYFQSGFPFDHDQWISSAATSFAVMALAPAAQTAAN